MNIKDVKILGREPDWFKRGVREAINIHKHKPSLNRDKGRYNLPNLWDNLLPSNQDAQGRMTEVTAHAQSTDEEWRIPFESSK